MPRKKSADAEESAAEKPKKKTVRRKPASKTKTEKAGGVSAADLHGHEKNGQQLQSESKAEHQETQSSDYPVDSFEIKPQIKMSDIKPKSSAAQPAMPASSGAQGSAGSSFNINNSPGSMAGVGAASAAAAAQPAGSESQPSNPQSQPAVAPSMSKPEPVGDSEFLAPEQFSFDLKKGHQTNAAIRKNRAKWLRTLVYFLSTIIVLMVIALFTLTFYSARKLNEQQMAGSTPTQNQTAPSTQIANPVGSAQQAGGQKLAIQAPDNLKSALAQAIQSQLSGKIQFDPTSPNLPASASDMLYIKTAGPSFQLTDFLKKYFISPQLQQKPDLADDFGLYLAPTIKSLNLSGLTAVVYNATSVNGAAKNLCTALKSYHVSSCTALNAANKQTGGLIVKSSKQNLSFALGRTAEFQSASFVSSDPGQVEDIRVIIAK